MPDYFFGLKNSGKIVTAAGLIMVSVFASFIFAEDTMEKSMGLALAFGIFFDAFIVRLMIVPAAMTLLGKSAWYFPKWLVRILPKIDVGGNRFSSAKLNHSVKSFSKQSLTGQSVYLAGLFIFITMKSFIIKVLRKIDSISIVSLLVYGTSLLLPWYQGKSGIELMHESYILLFSRFWSE
nr:MMPL family transporter [Cohnella sp. GbtcB17]